MVVPIQQAINEGYNGAFTSIFDANLTTILTAIILYAVGTGPIQGFRGNSCIRCGNFNVYSDYWNTCYRELPIRR